MQRMSFDRALLQDAQRVHEANLGCARNMAVANVVLHQTARKEHREVVPCAFFTEVVIVVQWKGVPQALVARQASVRSMVATRKAKLALRVSADRMYMALQ